MKEMTKEKKELLKRVIKIEKDADSPWAAWFNKLCEKTDNLVLLKWAVDFIFEHGIGTDYADVDNEDNEFAYLDEEDFEAAGYNDEDVDDWCEQAIRDYKKDQRRTGKCEIFEDWFWNKMQH